MMEIALIGDKHTIYGFRLAGIKKTFLIEDSRQEDIRGILKGLFEDSTALILITEKIAEEIRDILKEMDRFRKGIMPIILQIPDSGGPLISKGDPMRELIKRTIGFEIA
ncbi:MAG: V-type ATP synthase subunit F [Deltaproteobacteria bacterium]|nr:V-type ATP synthase subunit F [Deltaproteobacteria bacterium]MBW2333758.1 V-type ATP synthase subunit F [Deltaproteobacteria bacterium]